MPADHEPAPVGRLLRHDGSGWQPVGEPLPPFEFAPPNPQLPFAPWVLPRELQPQPFDVVVVGEIAHQLMARCAEDDEVVEELATAAMIFHEPHEVMRWMTEIEVWLGRRLDPELPWSLPPV